MPLQPVDNTLRDGAAFVAGILFTLMVIGCLVPSCEGEKAPQDAGGHPVKPDEAEWQRRIEAAREDERRKAQQPQGDLWLAASVENRTSFTIPFRFGNPALKTATMQPSEAWICQTSGTVMYFVFDGSLEDGFQERSYKLDRTILAGQLQDADKPYIQAYQLVSEWRNGHYEITMVRK